MILLVVEHMLVVGGTGMLSGATEELLRRGFQVSVVARHKTSFDHLINEHLDPIACDYSNTEAFIQAVGQSITRFGPISIAVLWIHSHAMKSLTALLRLLSEDDSRCKVFHIVGSTSGDPQTVQPVHYAQLSNISYHRVVLGCIRTGNSVRWLTDEEISTGVIRAIDNPNTLTWIGEP